MTPKPLIERTQFDFGLDEHFFDRTLDGMTVPLVVIDATGSVIYGNFAAIDLTGWSFEEALGRNMLDFVHPDDQEFIAQTFLEFIGMDSGQTILGTNVWSAIRFKLVAKDGTVIPVDVSGKTALKDGAINGVALAIHDVRIETVGQRILRGIAVGDDIEEMLRELTDAIKLPPADLEAAVYRSHGRHHLELVHATHPVLEALELDNDEVGPLLPAVGQINRFVTSELPLIGQPLLSAGYEEFLHTGVASPDGSVVYRFVAVSPIYIPAGRAGLHRLEWAQELTNLMLIYDRAKRVLMQEATMDPLTGLRNRRGLTDYVNELPADQSCFVLFIDLDDFKSINDEHGHSLGDRTLQIVADRIRRAVRLDDVVCRFGGDEFAIVLSADDTELDGAETVAHRVVTTLNDPIRLDDMTLDLSASVGVARSTTPLEPESFFHAADEAMYAAKRAGGGRYAIADQRDSDNASSS